MNLFFCQISFLWYLKQGLKFRGSRTETSPRYVFSKSWHWNEQNRSFSSNPGNSDFANSGPIQCIFFKTGLNLETSQKNYFWREVDLKFPPCPSFFFHAILVLSGEFCPVSCAPKSKFYVIPTERSPELRYFPRY